MPVFAADVLPETTGRNLGSPPQRWNGFFQDMDVQGLMKYQPTPGAVMRPSGTLYVLTAAVSAAQNTTAWQSFTTVTLPGGLLNAAGKVLRGTIGGTWTVQPGQTPNMDVEVRLAHLQIFGVSQTGVQAGQPNMIWRATFDSVVISPGTSAQIVRHGQFLSQYTTAGGNETMAPLIDVNATPVGPIDLTQDQPLQINGLFTSNTSPANSITLDLCIIEVLN